MPEDQKTMEEKRQGRALAESIITGALGDTVVKVRPGYLKCRDELTAEDWESAYDTLKAAPIPQDLPRAINIGNNDFKGVEDMAPEDWEKAYYALRITFDQAMCQRDLEERS
jgi:hypothetical protein